MFFFITYTLLKQVYSAIFSLQVNEVAKIAKRKGE